MNCPGFEKLVDYLDHQLVAPEASRVEDHLATGCLRCAESREWYEGFRLTAASDDSVAPPPWVLKRAVKVFENQQSRPRLRERIGQLAASLIFDSFAHPAVAGVRSAESPSRQLLYRADGYSIDLQVAPFDKSRSGLIGQVLKEGEAAFDSVAGLKVELVGGGDSIRITETDRLGKFAISGMRHDEYELRIETPHGRITIPGVPITQS